MFKVRKTSMAGWSSGKRREIFMETTVNDTVQEIGPRSSRSPKKPVKWKLITGSTVVAAAVLVAGISYYQATRFNANIKINNTNVGGLTADQALNKLKSSLLKNQVYVGQEQIFDGKDTKMEFTNQDLPSVTKLLKNQWTFFPSFKEKNYSMMPSNGDQGRTQTMKKMVEQKLIYMNKSLKAPKDAEAQLVNGQITVSKSIDGEQYDVSRLLQDFQKQQYNSEIRLSPAFIKPVKEDSPIVKKETEILQALIGRTVNYKVQDKMYSLNGSELIKNASVSKDMKITIDPAGIKSKINEINKTQATLDKNFTFKTHSGSVISVKARGYGWAIDADAEAKWIQDAFEKGTNSITASHIYGHGWGNEGIGYQTIANNGIGDTYAEVSISEQRIWIYRNGKLAVTTNVVTGRHNTHEDTERGIWYILYKRSPSTLTGSEVGNLNYSVKVQYWAPFTNGGQGFHDASWRHNWASNAYLTAGSGGCVNTPSNVMPTVYANLSTFEPVVIY